MTQIIFYIFGAMLLLSATMVVVIKNPIHAALFLVLSFFSSAAVWLLLNAEFSMPWIILRQYNRGNSGRVRKSHHRRVRPRR